ncbi:MAG TPA: hypothetical protein VG651_16660 [Stellaceae bacterium]|nr:hypothetical protein [Stellaceae bacterium]
MTRTKWMRLGVRDPADIMRWAAGQNARHLDEFRYRVIHGREYVSFRMIPRYAIQIGTSDIVVVAHVKLRRRQVLAAAATAYWRSVRQRAAHVFATLKPGAAAAAPVHTAAVYQFASARLPSQSHG